MLKKALKKSGKKSGGLLKSAVIVFLLVAVFIPLYVFAQLRPVDSSDTTKKSVVIPQGASLGVIGEKLEEEGLIRNARLFSLVARSKNLDKKLQAGSFQLSPNMTPTEIAQALTEGTNDLWVTLLEGWRAEQIAESLSDQLEFVDYDEFLQLAASNEGTLFPDTYLVPREITTEAMFSLLTNTFEQKVTVGLSDDIETFESETGYTFEQALVMASLVEREARDYDQMRHVAGILWNRMDIGMALQVDATLQYARGYDEIQQEWWAPPLGTDRDTPSPFNTYLNPGLPPRPIANPGLDAIRATLNPLDVDDLFYLHASDGSMYYAQTLDGHNANIERYLR